jgi:hypothetical protein
VIIESSLAEVSPGLLAQIRNLHDEAWPAQPAEAQDRPIHDPELNPWSMVLVADGTVLACADILSKDLVHEGRSYRAAGISAVVTRVDARGRGHGLRLVTAEYERMASQGVDLGIFTCDAECGGSTNARGGDTSQARLSSVAPRTRRSRVTSPASTR